MARRIDRRRHCVTRRAGNRRRDPRARLQVCLMRADAERGRELVAAQIDGWCRRARAAVTATAPGHASDVDNAVDVCGARRMTRRTVAARVTRRRWRSAMTLGAATRRRIRPARCRCRSASVVQRRSVTVDVRARRAVPRRRTAAIRGIERRGGARTERDARWCRDRDSVVQDVAVLIPGRRHDMALATGDARAGMRRVRIARRTRAVAGHARRRPVCMTRHARHAGGSAAEIRSVTPRALREAPVGLLQEVHVEVRARGIEDSLCMHGHGAVAGVAGLRQDARIRAAREHDDHEPFHGAP